MRNPLQATDKIWPRPVYFRHLLRTLRNFADMPTPSEKEKQDAILVLADAGNEAYPGLWEEAHRILDEAKENA